MDLALSSNALSETTIRSLYNLKPSEFLAIYSFPQGNAIKIAMRRNKVSGDIGESDVFGAQQFAPILDLKIDSDSEA
jgi:hypothetical protein